MDKVESIRIFQRGTGHWDVYGDKGRLCKIRGSKGSYCVQNERWDIPDKDNIPTVADAVKYICVHMDMECDYE